MTKPNHLNPYTLEEFPLNPEIEYNYLLSYKDKPIIGILEVAEKTYRIDFLSPTISYRDIFVLIGKMEAVIETFCIDTSEIPRVKMRMVKNVLRDLDYVSIGNSIYRYNFYR